MKTTKWLLLVLTLAVSSVHAMEGVFDRSVEIADYIEQFNSDLPREQLIKIAKTVYTSGISDEKLAQAIGNRLLKDIRELNDYRTASQYGQWMVMALGSTGTHVAGDLITSACRKTAVEAILAECKTQLKQLAWERRKDEIMSSRVNYNEGDNMRVSQLLSLLQADDWRYKLEAIYGMTRGKILDDRLMQEIAKQLQTFVNKNGISQNKKEYQIMARYCKLLGYSHDPKYRPVLFAVTKSNAPEILVRANAKRAIKHIDDNEPNNEPDDE